MRIPMKWIALILIAIGTLMALRRHSWTEIVLLWSTAAVALLFVHSRGVGAGIRMVDSIKERLQPKPKFQVVPKSSRAPRVEPDDVYESIDPILDKISKSGINSLTASERRALDRARNQLLKKGK